MTHADLVARAVRWLRGAHACRVVVWKRNVLTWEQPDAIGWTAGGVSVLVECKASRADFLRDAAKPFRRFPQLGMGVRRFFLAPAGLLTAADVPPGWGLAECLTRKVRVVVAAPDHADRHVHNELMQLVRYGADATPGPDVVGQGSHI